MFLHPLRFHLNPFLHLHLLFLLLLTECPFSHTTENVQNSVNSVNQPGMTPANCSTQCDNGGVIKSATNTSDAQTTSLQKNLTFISDPNNSSSLHSSSSSRAHSSVSHKLNGTVVDLKPSLPPTGGTQSSPAPPAGSSTQEVTLAGSVADSLTSSTIKTPVPKITAITLNATNTPNIIPIQKSPTTTTTTTPSTTTTTTTPSTTTTTTTTPSTTTTTPTPNTTALALNSAMPTTSSTTPVPPTITKLMPTTSMPTSTPSALSTLKSTTSQGTTIGTTKTALPLPSSSASTPPPNVQSTGKTLVHTVTVNAPPGDHSGAPGTKVAVVETAGADLTKQLVDTATLLAVLLFGLLFFVVVVALFIAQAYESYKRKDYTQVDYLINGMYSDSGV